MVDCGSSRCAQDRRVLKRELLTWTKKVPILLGLEQIAERYADRRQFKEHMEPLRCLESHEAQDWIPSTTCCFCDVDKTATTTTPEENQNVTEKPAEQDVCESFKPEPENTAFDYYPHFMPLAFPSPAPPDDSIADHNKPLDLSANSRRRENNHELSNSSSEELAQPLVELKVPQITNKIGKKKDVSGKRSYTEDDLCSAVNDIRSGKLGTRRAAALYGIPRSTLRNKIFRMEAENAYEHPCTGSLSMSDLLQNMAHNEAAKNDWSADDWEHKLELLRRKHDLNAGLERPFGMPPLFFNNRHLMDCDKAFSMASPFDYEAKLPFLQELVRKFAEHRMEAERAHCLGLPFLSELMHGAPGCSNGPGAMMSGTLPTAPVELKIPSYKPIRSYNGSVHDLGGDLSPTLSGQSPSSNSSASNKINDTLKDIIAKNIAEKVRSRSQPNEQDMMSGISSDDSSLTNGFSNIKNARETPDLPLPTPKKVKREAKSSEKPSTEPQLYGFNNNSDQKTEEDSDGKPLKKTRPKRGQYRKYNSQLLLEAVRAVQRGEMSVHRAGSYFGVPHSTLEYKVKERHLLRQKKPREARGKKSTTTTTTTSSAASTDKSSPGLNIPNPSGTTSSPSSSSSIADSGPASGKGADAILCDPDDDFESGDTTGGFPPKSDSSETSTNSYSPTDHLPLEPPRMDIEPLNHSVTSLLSAGAMAMNSLGGLPLPGAPLLPNFYMGGSLPLGFGWPPMMKAGLPLGIPDPAMAAASCLPGYGMNLSASDLLKKLQRKVQAQTSPGSSRSPPGGSGHDPSQPLQGTNKSNSSQVIVK